MLPYIRELIIVEGLHDERAIKQTVNATVLCLGGWAGTQKKIALFLKKAEATGRGILFFLDSDETGSLLESHLRQNLNFPEKALSALVEEEFCQKRKKIGLEYAQKKDILLALKRAGATFLSYKPHDHLTNEQLRTLKLKDNAQASQYRQKIAQHFTLTHTNPKRLLEQLNFLGITQQEIQSILDNKDLSLEEPEPKQTN